MLSLDFDHLLLRMVKGMLGMLGMLDNGQGLNHSVLLNIIAQSCIQNHEGKVGGPQNIKGMWVKF